MGWHQLLSKAVPALNTPAYTQKSLMCLTVSHATAIPIHQHAYSSHRQFSSITRADASPAHQYVHNSHVQALEPASLGLNLAHQHVCSNHSPTTIEGSTKPTWGISLEQLALVKRGDYDTGLHRIPST